MSNDLWVDFRPLRFSPYHVLGGVPNVVVDGSATEGTVLVLSHWPQSVVPAGLEADLSAEMAFTYLRRGDLHEPAAVVSNNHFDQDGLVSVFALVQPDAALARWPFLVDLAAAGDFATYRDRAAARTSMAIAAFADPVRSPLGETPDDYPTWCAVLYEELLGRLPELCDHPDRYRQLWAVEDETLSASEAVVRSGAVQIEEVPSLDLAVITLPENAPDGGGHRFASQWVTGLHPMAVNNASERLALLSMRGSSYEFTYRYESWVQYRSRRPRPRVDLRPLADELTADETSGGHWVFEGVETLTPRLYLRGAEESSLTPSTLRSRLEAHLATSEPAWNPYVS
jgi:hypothetical protein